jgi:hypothetical protein
MEETILKPIMRGDSKTYKFTITYDDAQPNANPPVPATPFDLTGHILTMSFKEQKDSKAYLTQVVGTISGNDNNIALFYLGSSKSKKLCAGICYWDAQIKKTSTDFCDTVGYGSVEVLIDVTVN